MAFWKKNCKRCGRKIEKGFSYCPSCGFPIDREKEKRDYGFLGRKDVDRVGPFRREVKLPLGFNTVFKKLVNEMDKQFRELDREIGREKTMKKAEDKDRPIIRQGGISINISSGAGKPIINVKSFGNMPKFKKMEQELTGSQTKPVTIKKNEISEEKARKLAKLPREEAASKVRRLSGKVVYEIDLPGVKNSKDVIVNQLENSIEVKAFSKDKAYFKFLPVALPLKNHKFSKGKLILELGEK